MTCLKERKIFMPGDVLPKMRDFVNARKRAGQIAESNSTLPKRPRVEPNSFGRGSPQVPMSGQVNNLFVFSFQMTIMLAFSTLSVCWRTARTGGCERGPRCSTIATFA